MSNYYTLGELAKARQRELRQEAQYAAQLRQMSSASRRPFVRSHWKLAIAASAVALIAVLAVLSQGSLI
jgi:hypothetical protein